MAVAAAAVAGCSSSGGSASDTSAAGNAAPSAASSTGPASALKQAEQTIAANAHNYQANYSKPDSGEYGMKIITALNQVKQQCGTASWQTAI